MKSLETLNMTKTQQQTDQKWIKGHNKKNYRLVQSAEVNK